MPCQRILEYITERLHAIPQRLIDNDVKLTLPRIAELEAQINAVAKLHQENALMRRSGKRPLEQYVTFDQKLSPAIASTKQLHYVGTTQDAKELEPPLAMSARLLAAT